MLSGRLLACLAAGSVLLVSAWRGIPAATVVISVGGATILAGIGVAWMKRVQPRVPVADHPVAGLADHAAALLDAGMSLRNALAAAVGQRPDGDLQDVVRRVHLGLPWDAALVRSPDRALRSLGQECGRRGSTGMPVSEALAGLAADLREQRRRELAIEARRAPVLLILPLTLCFLPAFGLVMVVPLLRSITG
jgi:Flp pilus assembly protein TadB